MRDRDLVLSLLLLAALCPTAEGQRRITGFNIIASLDSAPGNITVTADGRTIMSLHQFYEPQYSVVELNPGNVLVPFPNEAIANTQSQAALKLDAVLGIRSDERGIVWMLDNGMRGGSVPKLLAWDPRQNALYRVIYLPPPITPADAFVNDLAIDTGRNAIYISDPAGGQNAALIVVDLMTGASRRVLQGHSSVTPEAVDLIIDGRPLQIKDKAGKLAKPHIGVDPIALDTNNEWVYFGPMHGTSMYRIKAADLANPSLTDSELAARVERYGDKPICDGIAIDTASNIYLGELVGNAIGVLSPERKYQRLFQNEDLSWVDGFSFGPGGKLYAVVNRLHQSAALNGGVAVSKPPYFVLEITPLAEGIAGR